MSSILFRLTDDALIVANSGVPFQRAGVISVCHLHLSEKREKPEDIFGDDLIREITDSVVEVYKASSNRLTEDTESEKALSGDYNGRLVWELLQNADDAAVADARADGHCVAPIGAKGLGFKSVLEISDTPEIYSGDFCFRFSREDTRDLLNTRGVEVSDHQDVPAFRIPHESDIDEESQCLLNSGYSTVIRLPFRNGAKDIARKRLSELQETCLIFCQRLSQVKISIEGEGDRVFEIERNDGLEVSTFALINNGVVQKWRRWLAVQENGEVGRVSVCMPIGSDGKVEALAEDQKLHVFFPTGETVRGVKAMIHALYELESNREHLRNEQPEAESIRKEFQQLLECVLQEIPTVTALQAFGKVEIREENGDELNRLRNVIAETVRDTAFVPTVGGHKIKPGDARIWRHNLAEVVCEKHDKVHAANLLAPALAFDKNAESILEQLSAKLIGILQHAELLRHCKQDTPEQCFRAWRVAVSIIRDAHTPYNTDAVVYALKRVPFWWTGSGVARALDGDKPLLEKRPGNWPSWLDADALDPEFMEKIVNEEKVEKKAIKESQSSNDKTRMREMKDKELWPLVGDRGYFKFALLPFCVRESDENPREWWEKHGLEVLPFAFKWNREPEELPIIIDDERPRYCERNRIGKIIRLPTDRGWLPAIQCYAGKAWDGPASFDTRFEDIKDRGVVSPFETWEMPSDAENNKDKWKGFLRFLGVSWMPKMFFQDNLFVESLDHKRDYSIPSPRTRMHNDKQYYFEKSAMNAIADEEAKFLLPILKNMFHIANNNDAVYFYRRSQCAYSAAYQQMKNAKIIPCERSILCPGEKCVAPDDAYMPGCSLDKLLPEVRREGIENNDWHGSGGIEDILKGLGVRDKLPEDKEKFHGWMESLKQQAEQCEVDDKFLRWDSQNRGRLAKAAKAIFYHYLNLEDSERIPESNSVPFLRKTDKGEFLAFAPACEVFWADQSYFADGSIRDKILRLHEKEGVRIFFLFLRDGKADKAGLSPLSEKLKMSFTPTEEIADATECFHRIYTERKLILAKAAGCSFPENLNIRKYDKIYAESRDYPEIHLEVDYSWKEGTGNLSVTASLVSLARGLTKTVGKDGLTSNLQVLLMAENKQECLDILRKDYKFTEESLESLQSDSRNEQEKVNGSKEEDTVPLSPVDTKINPDDIPTLIGIDVGGGGSDDGSDDVGGGSSGGGSGGGGGSGSRGGSGGGSGGGGEGEEHKKIKDRLARFPQEIGISPSDTPETEYVFRSSDKADLLFRTGEEWIAVEVKPSHDPDIKRGLYQCVKYEALLKAEIKVDKEPVKGRTILVVGRELSQEEEELRKILDIEFKVVKISG